MSISQIDANADKEMEAFLSQMQNGGQPSQQQTQDTTANAQKDDELDENDFAVDDDEGGGDSQPYTQSQKPSTEQATTTQQDKPRVDMYTAEQLEYERRLAEERGKNAAFSQMMSNKNQPHQTVEQQQYQQQQQQPIFDPSEITITDEELQTYGKDASSYVEKIAKQVALRLYEKAVSPLQQQIQQQQAVINQSRNDTATQQSQLLFQRIQAAIPEVQNITQSQEWRNYLQSPAPGTGGRVPLANLLEHNIRSGNYDGIKEIFDIYLDRNKQQGLQSQVSPGRSQVSTPPSTLATNKKRNLAYSKLLNTKRRFESGQISYDEYLRVEALYDKAAIEDRIDYDK